MTRRPSSSLGRGLGTLLKLPTKEVGAPKVIKLS
jgi:hypothetical protein